MYTQNNKGQAAIEFLLVFAFGLGLTFLFLSLTLNSTSGYLAQYANFMASRTFLTYDQSNTGDFKVSVNDAAKAARDVFNSYPLKAFDIDAEFKVLKPGIDAPSSLYAGATIKFKKRLTPFKLVGGGAMINFFTESFLSKEPVRSACFEGTCQGLGQRNCSVGIDATLFDNGC